MRARLSTETTHDYSAYLGRWMAKNWTPAVVPPPPPQHFYEARMARPLRLQTGVCRRLFWRVAIGRAAVDQLVLEWEGSPDVLLACLYLAYAPPEAVRHVLQIVWCRPDRAGVHSWDRLYGNLLRMFRYAAFPLPDDLPAELTIYRGLNPSPGSGRLLEWALDPSRYDRPWTTDRDVACAMATANQLNDCIMVRRTVPRSAILFHGPGYGGGEVDFTEIVFDAEPDGGIEGDRAEWFERQDYVTSRRQGCPVIGPVGTGLDPVENLGQAMDGSGRHALECLRTRRSGSAYNGEVWARQIPYPLRGAVLLALYQVGAPKENVRGMFTYSWVNSNDRRIVRSMGTDETLWSVMAYCDFPVPDELPARVTIFRGSTGISVDKARRGRSWTLHRDMACFFATTGARARGYTGAPLVLRREIDLSSAVLLGFEKLRSEVILDPALHSSLTEDGCAIDGEPGEWAERGEAFWSAVKSNPYGEDQRTEIQHARTDASVRFWLNSNGDPEHDRKLALGV